jgi:hypothetical protein
MRLLYFIILFFSFNMIFGQGLEPSQIQGAPRLNDVLQAKNMYIDEYGDTLYIYEHVDIDGIIIKDSIYLRNDTIFLNDGNGFVKIPKQGTVKGTGVATRVAWWAGTDSLSSDAALYWDNVNKRLGVNNLSPQYEIDINGTLRVATRTGTAATGAGFTADGQLVAYSLDTGATTPNTYVTSGMYINVTGSGTFADPYVINNTFGNQEITSVTKSPGNIAVVEAGNTWNLNINDADSVNTNELQDLYPYSTGFALSHITNNLQDTVLFNYEVSGGGTFTPASDYIAGTGINITGDTIKSTVVNTDAQAISKTGNVISITGNVSTVNISQTVTPASGNVLTWDGTQWNAAAAAGGTTIEESVNGGTVTIGTSMTTICDVTLTAGTWKVDAVASYYSASASVDLTMELFNVTSNTVLFTSVDVGLGVAFNNMSATKKVTLGSTSTIRLRAIKDGGSTVTVAANRGIITAIK